MRLILFAILVQQRAVDGAPPAQCGPAAQPLFEFEVTRPATLISTAREGPRPVRHPVSTPRSSADSVIVQFVIDTTGTPVPRTFEVLRSPSRKVTDRVRAAHHTWRFRPALIGGCKVPQVVQAAIEWVAAPGEARPGFGLRRPVALALRFRRSSRHPTIRAATSAPN